jgi:uncharacterized protein (TIGR04168 family)
MNEREFTIALVGDVHDKWEFQDQEALIHLNVDLVLFVGDFGNESVQVVEKVSSLPINKAVILGNHDAWYTASEWGKKNRPYNPAIDNWFTKQLDLLGDTHVGYSKLDFPSLELSVVGGRPFTWGGAEWKNKEFLQTLYQVNNFQESTAKIVSAARKSTYDNLIFLAHNGPYGLGNKPYSINGRDWGYGGGDFGDHDLTDAINIIRQEKKVPLVVFGHMHHSLRYTSEYIRQRITIDEVGTVYLNVASVPRIIRKNDSTIRNFTMVTFKGGEIFNIDLIWIDDRFNICQKENLSSKISVMG